MALSLQLQSSTSALWKELFNCNLCQICLTPGNTKDLCFCAGNSCYTVCHSYCYGQSDPATEGALPAQDESDSRKWYCNLCKVFESCVIESNGLLRSIASDRLQRLVHNNNKLRQNADETATPGFCFASVNPLVPTPTSLGLPIVPRQCIICAQAHGAMTYWQNDNNNTQNIVVIHLACATSIFRCADFNWFILQFVPEIVAFSKLSQSDREKQYNREHYKKLNGLIEFSYNCDYCNNPLARACMGGTNCRKFYHPTCALLANAVIELPHVKLSCKVELAVQGIIPDSWLAVVALRSLPELGDDPNWYVIQPHLYCSNHLECSSVGYKNNCGEAFSTLSYASSCLKVSSSKRLAKKAVGKHPQRLPDEDFMSSTITSRNNSALDDDAMGDESGDGSDDADAEMSDDASIDDDSHHSESNAASSDNNDDSSADEGIAEVAEDRDDNDRCKSTSKSTSKSRKDRTTSSKSVVARVPWNENLLAYLWIGTGNRVPGVPQNGDTTSSLWALPVVHYRSCSVNKAFLTKYIATPYNTTLANAVRRYRHLLSSNSHFNLKTLASFRKDFHAVCVRHNIHLSNLMQEYGGKPVAKSQLLSAVTAATTATSPTNTSSSANTSILCNSHNTVVGSSTETSASVRNGGGVNIRMLDIPNNNNGTASVVPASNNVTNNVANNVSNNSSAKDNSNSCTTFLVANSSVKRKLDQATSASRQKLPAPQPIARSHTENLAAKKQRTQLPASSSVLALTRLPASTTLTAVKTEPGVSTPKKATQKQVSTPTSVKLPLLPTVATGTTTLSSPLELATTIKRLPQKNINTTNGTSSVNATATVNATVNATNTNNNDVRDNNTNQMRLEQQQQQNQQQQLQHQQLEQRQQQESNIVQKQQADLIEALQRRIDLLESQAKKDNASAMARIEAVEKELQPSKWYKNQQSADYPKDLPLSVSQRLDKLFYYRTSTKHNSRCCFGFAEMAKFGAAALAAQLEKEVSFDDTLFQKLNTTNPEQPLQVQPKDIWSSIISSIKKLTAAHLCPDAVNNNTTNNINNNNNNNSQNTCLESPRFAEGQQQQQQRPPIVSPAPAATYHPGYNNNNNYNNCAYPFPPPFPLYHPNHQNYPPTHQFSPALPPPAPFIPPFFPNQQLPPLCDPPFARGESSASTQTHYMSLPGSVAATPNQSLIGSLHSTALVSAPQQPPLVLIPEHVAVCN
jgi:hypothetical protein